MSSLIERFNSRDQRFNSREEKIIFNSYRIVLEHQYGRRDYTDSRDSAT